MGGRNRWNRSKVAPFDFYSNGARGLTNINLLHDVICHYGVNQIERAVKEFTGYIKYCYNYDNFGVFLKQDIVNLEQRLGTKGKIQATLKYVLKSQEK